MTRFALRILLAIGAATAGWMLRDGVGVGGPYWVVLRRSRAVVLVPEFFRDAGRMDGGSECDSGVISFRIPSGR